MVNRRLRLVQVYSQAILSEYQTLQDVFKGLAFWNSPRNSRSSSIRLVWAAAAPDLLQAEETSHSWSKGNAEQEGEDQQGDLMLQSHLPLQVDLGWLGAKKRANLLLKYQDHRG